MKAKKVQSLKLILLNIAVVLSFISAFIISANRANVDVELFFPEFFENAGEYVKLDQEIYSTIIKTPDASDTTYLAIGEAMGYGGMLKVLTAVNNEGTVLKTEVVEQSETPSWFKEVIENHFLLRLKEKSYADNFILGTDVDGVSGATYTSRAIMEATKNAARHIAFSRLNYDVIKFVKPSIAFGIPEITLLLLFAVAIVSYKKKFKHKKTVRWISLISAMIILGFVFERPLNLVIINKFFAGFWPDWRLNLYWYILIGGVALVLLIDKKNIYCNSICPFGATQECIGKIGQAKVYNPGKYTNLLKWTRRVVVWFAIIIALIFRNPGISSYEVFGTMFSLTGTNLQFLLLTIVLLASFFIKKPWCSFLCPIKVVEDYTRYVSNLKSSIWKKEKANPIKSQRA